MACCFPHASCPRCTSMQPPTCTHTDKDHTARQGPGCLASRHRGASFSLSLLSQKDHWAATWPVRSEVGLPLLHRKVKSMMRSKELLTDIQPVSDGEKRSYRCHIL